MQVDLGGWLHNYVQTPNSSTAQPETFLEVAFVSGTHWSHEGADDFCPLQEILERRRVTMTQRLACRYNLGGPEVMGFYQNGRTDGQMHVAIWQKGIRF